MTVSACTPQNKTSAESGRFVKAGVQVQGKPTPFLMELWRLASVRSTGVWLCMGTWVRTKVNNFGRKLPNFGDFFSFSVNTGKQISVRKVCDFGFKFKNIKVKLWSKNEIRYSENEIVNPGEDMGKVAGRTYRNKGEPLTFFLRRDWIPYIKRARLLQTTPWRKSKLQRSPQHTSSRGVKLHTRPNENSNLKLRSLGLDAKLQFAALLPVPVESEKKHGKQEGSSTKMPDETSSILSEKKYQHL